MQKEDYQKLISLCDLVLQSEKATISTVSIPWLHVLNEHPNNLKQYLKLYHSGYNYFNYLLDQLKFLLVAFSRIFSFKKFNINKIQKKDVVIISHLLNEEQINDNNDFYFGSIPNDIKKAGISCQLLLINHTQRNSSNINKLFQQQNNNEKVVLSSKLKFRKECLIFKKLARESSKFRKIAAKQTDSFERKFFRECASRAISPFSFSTLRIYEELKDYFSNAMPKVVLTTFEGHAWERLVFACAREVNPDVKCIGYHHTLIFPKQHAAKRPLAPIFNPNIIFTTGHITASYFKSEIPNSEIMPVGIHRRTVLNDQLSKNSFISKDISCLVAPEGIISEITFMFDFAISAAKSNPQVRFIFRLHPLISKDSLLSDYPRYKELPENVFFSNRSLLADFKRSRWIFYRGSSTGIYAVLEGVRPFYLSKKGEMSVDPLFSLKSWRKTLDSYLALKKFIVADLNKSETDLLLESAEAFHFCNSYFLPLDKTNFLNIVIQGINNTAQTELNT